MNKAQTQRTMENVGPRPQPTLPKSKAWAARWDRKCKADFAEYTPPINTRLL